MNIITYLSDNPSKDRLLGFFVMFIIIALSFAAGILYPNLEKDLPQDTVFIAFIPFAVLLAAAIFISFSKESKILYPDEVDDSNEELDIDLHDSAEDAT